MKLLFLDPEWKSKTVATLRWQLIQVAGRLIRHGRGLILRLAASFGLKFPKIYLWYEK